MCPVTWLKLPKLGCLTSGALHPGAELAQDLLHPQLLTPTLPVPTGWCVTALCCCASRRGFTWALGLEGSREEWWAGIPSPRGQSLPSTPEASQSLGCVVSPQPGVPQSAARAGQGDRSCPIHIPLLPLFSDGSICFLLQTFGGPLLLALNPYRALPLFSPEVLASYHPGKTPNTTP